MKTKFANQIFPYITADDPIFKILSINFSKNFTAGFSTGYPICNPLYINAQKRLSTYQQPNYHQYF